MTCLPRLIALHATVAAGLRQGLWAVAKNEQEFWNRKGDDVVPLEWSLIFARLPSP